jgi:hypothetical protein
MSLPGEVRVLAVPLQGLACVVPDGRCLVTACAGPPAIISAATTIKRIAPLFIAELLL